MPGPQRLPDPGRSLGVAGLGLIGGSIVRRAAQLGWRVAGYDPDLRQAEALGDALWARTAALADLAGMVDTLVLAGPLEAIVAGLAELTARPPRAELVLDVASVKARVALAGAGVAAFVPSHPMAGSERSGASAARSDLFEGRTWAYDPAAPHAARAEAFIRAMGAVPIGIASAEHDRVVALTSHLPQVLSAALGAHIAERLGEPHVAQLCGPGLDSMLRLGESPWALWRAILAANAGPVAQEVRALAAILSEAAEALETGATDRLAERFDAAASAIARLRANDSAKGRVHRAGNR